MLRPNVGSDASQAMDPCVSQLVSYREDRALSAALVAKATVRSVLRFASQSSCFLRCWMTSASIVFLWRFRHVQSTPWMRRIPNRALNFLCELRQSFPGVTVDQGKMSLVARLDAPGKHVKSGHGS